MNGPRGLRRGDSPSGFFHKVEQYIHKEIQIRATTKTIECFYQGKRLAIHVRSYIKYKHTTLKEHMPPHHAAHAEWTPERMMRWAKKIGGQTEKFIECMIHARAFPQQAYRACLGVLRLGARYGENRLENACEIGLANGFTRYRQIENLLKNKLDFSQQSKSIPQITPVISTHENIRGSEYYKQCN